MNSDAEILRNVDSVPEDLKIKFIRMITVCYNSFNKFEVNIIFDVGFILIKDDIISIFQHLIYKNETKIIPPNQYIKDVLKCNVDDIDQLKPLIPQVQRMCPNYVFDIVDYEGNQHFDKIRLVVISNKSSLDKYYINYLPELPYGILNSILHMVKMKALLPIFQSGDTWAHLCEPKEILDNSCDLFLWNLCKKIFGNPYNGMYPLIDEISKMGYERQPTFGKIAFGHIGQSDAAVRLTAPVNLTEKRTLRKLLQICSSGGTLICDSHKIDSITDRPLRITKEFGFLIEFTGRNNWIFKLIDPESNIKPYFKASNGLISGLLPKIDRNHFSKEFTRVFGDDNKSKIPTLMKCLELAIGMQHGCILIISNIANDESERLKTQSITISPTHFSEKMLSGLFEVDGAVLIDLEGMCHAFGVILDGTCNPGIGERGRGSRYNSVVKYVNGQSGKALGLVISDDGDLNII
jgi:hypothetical protein